MYDSKRNLIGDISKNRKINNNFFIEKKEIQTLNNYNTTIKNTKKIHFKNRTIKREPIKKHHKITIYDSKVHKIELKNDNKNGINQTKQYISDNTMSENQLKSDAILRSDCSNILLYIYIYTYIYMHIYI